MCVCVCWRTTWKLHCEVMLWRENCQRSEYHIHVAWFQCHCFIASLHCVLIESFIRVNHVKYLSRINLENRFRNRNAYGSKLDSRLFFVASLLVWIVQILIISLITVIWVSKVTSMQINQLRPLVNTRVFYFFFRFQWLEWQKLFTRMWNDLCSKRMKSKMILPKGEKMQPNFQTDLLCVILKIDHNHQKKIVRIIVDKLISKIP